MSQQSVAYPIFTKEMVSTHTLLIPNMMPIHFAMTQHAIACEGYRVEVLQNGGPEVAQEGLKYVHNDTCYPALLVIGQFIDALKSGKYDVNRTALLITQTGGGCRASNYIHLLRKALVKAGFPQVPVASFNFAGLEKNSGFRMNLRMIVRMLASVFYGDMLMSLSNQIRPYENNVGEADALVTRWSEAICAQFSANRGLSKADYRANFAAMAADFAKIPVTPVPKVKVGVVGEIYVKYSPLGNNNLEAFLRGEDCEINLPGLMGFAQYCVSSPAENIHLYGGNPLMALGAKAVLAWLDARERLMHAAFAAYPKLHAPTLFSATRKLSKGIIGTGNIMGEGWLLTAEMMELQSTGFENIVCAQPFGCLPNHICGKGMINKIRSIYPNANITPIDYDPGATRVNQENRIKLMLSVAKERLDSGVPPSGGLPAPSIYGEVKVPQTTLSVFGEPLPVPAQG